MTSFKTLVLGASENPSRYSNMAVKRLRQYNHEVIAIGARKGKIDDVDIITEHPNLHDVDTITLYLSAKNQVPYYDYILSLKPRRIIYNPGSENTELEQLAEKAGIENLEACTLVMLGTGQY